MRPLCAKTHPSRGLIFACSGAKGLIYCSLLPWPLSVFFDTVAQCCTLPISLLHYRMLQYNKLFPLFSQHWCEKVLNGEAPKYPVCTGPSFKPSPPQGGEPRCISSLSCSTGKKMSFFFLILTCYAMRCQEELSKWPNFNLMSKFKMSKF